MYFNILGNVEIQDLTPGAADILARDTSFYYSFLVLPAEKRRAIIAVWDFCRAVDDAVDEAPAGAAPTDAAASGFLVVTRNPCLRDACDLPERMPSRRGPSDLV